MAQPTRVALALGGGGARGYAHIGVIQVLRERGYEIVSIAGSSMGAVVGGLHAAGRLGAYTDWVRTLTQRDVWRLLDPSFKAPGVIRAEKVLAQVSELLGDVVIEELTVPFTAVATDLLAGKEVWFQHGLAAPAIRASFALPSFISPVVLNGRLLADGGLLNPVPVAPMAAAPADVTVAVSLSEVHLTYAGAAPARGSDEAGLTEASLDRSRGTVAQMLDGELMRAISSWFTGGRGSSDADDDEEEEVAREFGDGAFGDLPPGLRTLDVMQLSLAALQRMLTRYQLAGYPPDLLITVPKGSCRSLDFHRANEMIALGRDRAEEALDREAPFPES